MRECGRAGAPASLGSPKEVTKGGGGVAVGIAPPLGSSRLLPRRIIPRTPSPALRKPPPRASQMKKYCGQVRNTRIVTNQIETLIFLLYLTGFAAVGGGFISAVNPRASSILFVPGNKSRLS